MRFIVTLCIVFSTATFADNMLHAGSSKSIEVTGFGEANVDIKSQQIKFSVERRGTSAVKLKQAVEHQTKLLQQFVAKNTKKVKIIAKQAVTLDVSYPALNNTIEQVEFISRLPNNLPAKINTKPQLTTSVNKNALIEAKLEIDVMILNREFYPHFIDYLFKLGITNIQSTEISLEIYQEHYQQALERALNNAKQKANKIAEELNIVVNGVVTVQEIIPNNGKGDAVYEHVSNTFKSNKSAEQEVVKAQVKAVFAIKP